MQVEVNHIGAKVNHIEVKVRRIEVEAIQIVVFERNLLKCLIAGMDLDYKKLQYDVQSAF